MREPNQSFFASFCSQKDVLSSSWSRLILYLILFLLGAFLDIALGHHATDPFTAALLARTLQGIHAGHFLLAVNGQVLEQSRLADACLWLVALPLAPFLGWVKSITFVSLACAPLCVGGLSALCAWAVEPFAPRRVLPLAVLTLVPFLLLTGTAAPGIVSPALLALVCLATAAGCVVRSHEPENGLPFLAGLLAGAAIWLTPTVLPLVAAGFGILLLRRWKAPPGAHLVSAGAGVLDMVGIGFVLDPPVHDYFGTDPQRLSLVYVAFGMALLLAGAGAWQLERRFPLRRARWLGVALSLGLAGVWLALFIVCGGRLTWPDQIAVAAIPAALYAGGRAYTARRGRAVWGFTAFCLALCAAAGLTGPAAAALAGLLPLAATDIWLRATTKPKSPWER
jgi:hypothetical protein